MAYEADFYRVAIDPWQSLRDEHALLACHDERGLRLLGVPGVVIYRGGKIVTHIYGEQRDLPDQVQDVLEHLKSENP